MKTPISREEVFKLVKKIPRGMVTTYGELAKAVGKPKAARAIGAILRANTRPIEIPCHRVVCSNGKVGGYSLGVDLKIRLLEQEGIRIKNGKIVNLRKHLYKFNST